LASDKPQGHGLASDSQSRDFSFLAAAKGEADLHIAAQTAILLTPDARTAFRLDWFIPPIANRGISNFRDFIFFNSCKPNAAIPAFVEV